MDQQVDGESSEFSRRNMILVLGGAVAAGGALLAAPFKSVIAIASPGPGVSSPVRRLTPLADAGYDQWALEVGSVFTLGAGTSMRLSGVRAMPAAGGRPANFARAAAFVAVFEPLNGATMAGDLIYGATHPQYGALRLFLTASSDPATPARMLAVFN